MKIEDLKVGRVYRAKRPRGVHRLDGSYVNDREILYISPFGESIQYDSPSVTFKAKYPIISTEKFLKWADKDITDYLFEVKMKTERIQQFKKAFTLYRRGGYSLAYRWKLYFIRDVRKKKLPNNFEK